MNADDLRDLNLQLRNDGLESYITVLDAEGRPVVDVVKIFKRPGEHAEITVGNIENLVDAQRGTLSSTELDAADAIKRIKAGEELDIEGETRVTVLRAAGIDPDDESEE